MVMLQAAPWKSNGGLGVQTQVLLTQFPFPEQKLPSLKQGGGGGGVFSQATPNAGGVQLQVTLSGKQFPFPEQKRPLFKQGGGLHW